MGGEYGRRERKEQGRQCTNNLILRRVRLTIVAVEKHYVLHILSVCLQPYLSSMQSACAVVYSNLWPVRLYYVFPPYLINGMIFGKMLFSIKCVFRFSIQLLSKIFLIL
jgi:hypothetical protein